MEPVRVLVVEDDTELCYQLTAALTDEGYHVAGARDGSEALALARSEDFDLIVADIRMQDMSGLDVIERVRADNPETHSLVITGYSTEADSIRAIQLGVGDYLKKPFRVGDFLARVGQQVAHWRQERRRQQKEEALRGLARSALRTLGDPPAASLGLQLAEEVGLPRSVAEEIELALLIAGLPNAPSEVLRHGHAEPEVGEILRAGHPVAELAQAASAGQEVTAEPVLLKALQRIRAGQRSETRRPGLLRLARALEAAGDRAGAAATFREIASTPSREAVAALLGLARARPEEARDHLRQAVLLARELGPTAAGEASLEAGLFLMPTGDPAAAPLLEEAARLLRTPAAAAQARLALLTLRPGEGEEEAVRTLLRPEHRLEYAASAPWLLPFLLRQNPAAAARVAADFPQLAERLGASTREPALPGLRVHTLGGFEVYRGEERVDEGEWRTRKVKHLLAFLCTQRGRTAVEDVLLDEFWPDDLERGRNSLRAAASHLRRCLRPSYWQGNFEFVVRKDGRMSLNPALPVWHDLEEVEAAIGRGDGRRVAQLYRGPFLDGWYMDWALAVRTRLENQVAAALLDLARSCLAERLAAEATEHAGRILEIDPCHQQAHLVLMQGHLLAGRPEEAVRQFERAQRILHTELEMEPSLELLEAHQRALLSI